MTRIISILRGVNVGKRKVLMADLKNLYEKLGLSQVSTYIQSGNVIFDTDEELTNQQLSKRIEKVF